MRLQILLLVEILNMQTLWSNGDALLMKSILQKIRLALVEILKMPLEHLQKV